MDHGQPRPLPSAVPKLCPAQRAQGSALAPEDLLWGWGHPETSHRGIQRGSRASLPHKLHLLSHGGLGRKTGLEHHWRILGHVGRYWRMPACTEAQWGVLACTGMPWRVVTMTGEALGSAELRVPTSDRFTRWAPFLTCREMRRCHWSLECPQSQQGMGGPNWPPVPTLAPQFQDLPQRIHLCLLLRPPAEAEQRFSLDWPLWGLGGSQVSPSPWCEGENPFCSPRSHSGQSHLIPVPAGTTVGMETRRARGIRGLQGRGERSGTWGPQRQ